MSTAIDALRRLLAMAQMHNAATGHYKPIDGAVVQVICREALASIDAEAANFLVIGRIIGDDEDACKQIRAKTAAQACAAFRAEMYALDGFTPEQIEQAEANGEGVLINHIFESREALREVSPTFQSAPK